MKQKVEITLETAEIIVLRWSEKAVKQYCPGCFEVVDMFSPYMAAMATGRSEREIFKLIESSELHYVETDRLMICLKSLNREIKEKLQQ